LAGAAVLALCLVVTAAPSAAQDSPAAAPQVAAPADQTVPDQPAVDGSPRRIGDPFTAYSEGAFDQALQGFVDRQVERPEDLALTFNIGAAHYQMKSYAEAEQAFAQVAVSADQELRQQALYNLGNCAFRQGRLEQAVELYMAALDIKPDDEDAKFNLEFVRDEIRRRHEEAKKRQEQQQQQGQQDPQQSQQDQQQGQQDPQQGQQGQDRDQDGLADQTEQQGKNPTNPDNPDTDQDGLRDGQEDQNQNGQVDPGETDPNKKDTDQDGVTDAQEAEQQPQGQQPQQQQAAGERPLSQEEAEALLQALEDERPETKRLPGRGQRARPLKDW
jgi:Ca-activated chloride channel family protein